jgi:23S rRNA (adenine2030-N6)-methyltransferase
VKYRHSFHAGNFADTLKHLVLLALLKSLARKPAPFFYLETHAGRGRYKLTPDNVEFAGGFGRLRGHPSLPPLLAEYVALVERLGSPDGSTLEFYAGSSLLAASLLRPDDRAMLFELGTVEAAHLQEAVHPYRNVSVQCADGYIGVRAQLPPRERRGMVLIDPAYELQDKEFPVVLKTLTEAHRRWANGTFAIWYPVKRHAGVQRFHEELRQTGIRKILCAQLGLYPDDSRVSLNGCGMILVNPPWQVEETLKTELPVLHSLLDAHPGTSGECFWLVPE